MKRLLHPSIAVLMALAFLFLTSVANAQQDGDPEKQFGPERLKQLFDKFAKSDWAKDPDADEIRKLLDRVKQGKPLSPEQFAKLFEKIQMNMPGQGNNERAKNNNQVRRAFRPVVAKAKASTVAILKDGKQAAAGTVVDSAGHILTKASELRDGKQFSNKLTCKPTGGKPRKAKIVGVLEDHDLALLKVDPQGLAPVRWHKSASPPVGSWLATTGLGEDPVAVGVVSVAARKIGFGGGFLGVMLGQAEKGPKVERVVPKSAAADAKLKVGDVVIKVEDQRIKTREQMVETVRDYKPGEVISLTIIRDGKEKKIDVTLGRRDMSGMRAGRLHAMNLMGGPISKRRTNFPNVLQHDTVLKPEQCGGPIVDLDGNVVGINIARAGRVMSYAVPAETIVSVLPRLKSGELSPKPAQFAAVEKDADNDKSKPELEAVLDDIRKAETELRDSQEKLRKAREALEKARENDQ